MHKKICAMLSVLFLVLLIGGCSKEDKHTLGYQLDKPAAGEEIAVIETSMGEMKLRFFPDAAPKAVENFKKLSEKGYYNGISFHRVIDGFMVQGGDPTATGSGGESAFGGPFKDEFSKTLVNIRGAVAMANSGANTNGSQFFINQTPASAMNSWEYYQEIYEFYKQSGFPEQTMLDPAKITDEYKKLYEDNGGNPPLDGAYNVKQYGHTVFAQVFEGLDVVDEIAAVPVDERSKPLTDVTITKITLEQYQEESSGNKASKAETSEKEAAKNETSVGEASKTQEPKSEIAK
ncbi:peptidylprolyl isomerase [Clostridium minihomine]|uniref:peptidylprolyl isomerase n=1 Tax=Clostridium minihomine TaxID=2045012 RepID=UPI000C77A1B5|nr:peptidylprolyl isomerase [Clostridium minihomine]